MNTQARAPNKPIHVLSIDGGGVRGVIPAEILAYITSQTKLAVHEMFDLVAGTSTGGIIALGLGTTCKNGKEPYTPRELSDLYFNNGAKIFEKPLFPALKQLLGPKYSEKPLEEVLNEYFGQTMLGSALTPLLIASYDLISQTPFFFKSHKIDDDPSYNILVRDIARATSAAPTYFPPFQIAISVNGAKQECCLLDGGVYANNPAMAAYAEARMLYPKGFQLCRNRIPFLLLLTTGNTHDPQQVWIGVKDRLRDLDDFAIGLFTNVENFQLVIVRLLVPAVEEECCIKADWPEVALARIVSTRPYAFLSGC